MYHTEKICSNKMRKLSLICRFQFCPYEESYVPVGSLGSIHCSLLPENGISVEVHFNRQNVFIPNTLQCLHTQTKSQ